MNVFRDLSIKSELIGHSDECPIFEVLILYMDFSICHNLDFESKQDWFEVQ
jgi:hypothetical protein